MITPNEIKIVWAEISGGPAVQNAKVVFYSSETPSGEQKHMIIWIKQVKFAFQNYGTISVA